MKRLNLGGNGLTSIPQRALSILDMLKKLELQENRIQDIREGDFEGEVYLLTHSIIFSISICICVKDFVLNENALLLLQV